MGCAGYDESIFHKKGYGLALETLSSYSSSNSLARDGGWLSHSPLLDLGLIS